MVWPGLACHVPLSYLPDQLDRIGADIERGSTLILSFSQCERIVCALLRSTGQFEQSSALHCSALSIIIYHLHSKYLSLNYPVRLYYRVMGTMGGSQCL